MSYPYPALWGACVTRGWATPQTCSPAEFQVCVVKAEMHHAGKGRVDKYANKALRKISQGSINGSTVPPLKSRLSQVVTANQQRLKAEAAMREVAENARKQREAEIANLRAQLANVQAALNAASTKLASVASSVGTFQAQLKNLTEELKKEKSVKESLEKKVDELARLLATSEANVSKLASEFVEARKEASASRQKTEQMEAQLAMILVEIIKLNERSAGQSADLQRLKQSQVMINDMLLKALQR